MIELILEMGSSYTWCNSKSYTFFKPLDLSRSNGQKKILINANILTNISLIISYLLHSILISKPNKKKTSNSLSLSLYVWCSIPLSFRLSPSDSLHCSSTTVPGCRQKLKKKKKKPIALTCWECSVSIVSTNRSSTIFPKKEKEKKTKPNCGCV